MQGNPTALTAQERHGVERFQKAGCLHCHGGPMLSDFALHELGLGDGAHAIQGRFRTPSLRNVARTGPYMHDGRYSTLRQVLVFYDELQERVTETLEGGDQNSEPRLDPLLRHLNIGPEDFSDIEAFLTALNDDHYEQGTPDRVPSGLPVLKDAP